jgi:hypothetical protein
VTAFHGAQYTVLLYRSIYITVKHIGSLMSLFVETTCQLAEESEPVALSWNRTELILAVGVKLTPSSHDALFRIQFYHDQVCQGRIT